MNTAIRAALQRLVEIDDANSINGADPDTTAWTDAIAAARAALAELEVWDGPSLADVDELCAEFGFHYDDTQGESLEILQQMVAAAPPAPETLAETLAARPLLEKVSRLGGCIGQQTVAQVQQLAEQASAWLRDNPPGQPVAIEPRGCPTPGACSCVGPTPPAPESLPANYIDPEHQSDDRELLETFYKACNAEGGTADEIHLRGIRSVLAARPTAPPAPLTDLAAKLISESKPMAPEMAEALTPEARWDLYEGPTQEAISVGEVGDLVEWLHGQDGGREKRAIHSRIAAPPAPEPGDVGEAGELVAYLQDHGTWLIQSGYANESVETRDLGIRVTRAATLLQQLSAPAPAVVPVAVAERPWEKGGWTDLDDECWWCPPDGPAYWSMANPAMVYGGWLLPAHAILSPLPQAGEVEA